MASRPLSAATTGSGELGGYYGAFEEVLAWLLEAEERLAAAAPPPPTDLSALKERFHQHEVCRVVTKTELALRYIQFSHGNQTRPFNFDLISNFFITIIVHYSLLIYLV